MIKSKDAWNSPENSKDFPRCDFEISHVDKQKQCFFCAIKISHENDSANTEVVALFEQVSDHKTTRNQRKQSLICKQKYMFNILRWN